MFKIHDTIVAIIHHFTKQYVLHSPTFVNTFIVKDHFKQFVHSICYVL